MRLTSIGIAALALSIHAPVGFAQTAAELLQKGIYTQETAGDLDGAIRIYRQIVNSSPDQRAYAAQAQYRLVQSLLQKGDLNSAMSELGNLARNYPEYADQAKGLAKSSPAFTAISRPRMASLGTLENGRYHNTSTGLEVTLPPGWSFGGEGRASDSGQNASFNSPEPNSLNIILWLKREDSAPNEIAVKLSDSVPAKVELNRGTPGFRFRPESMQPKMIGGQQALSAVADLGDDAHHETEYYTWIYTTKTHLVFLATSPASDLATLQALEDQLAAATVVP